MITFSVSSGLELARMGDKLREELETLLDNTSRRVASSMYEPIWNLNSEAIREYIISEKQNKHIIAIGVIFTELGFKKFIGRLGENDYTKYEAFSDELAFYPNLLSKSMDIKKGDQTIGIIELHITEKHIEEEIRRELMVRVYETIVILTVIIIILAIMLNISVLKPVQRLTDIAKIIAEGNLDLKIDLHRKDEIGLLARSFDHMRNAIRRHIKDLEQEITQRTKAEKELQEHQNHLEELVEKRTNRLIEAETKTRSLLENSPDIIVNINRDLIIQYMNRGIGIEQTVNIIGESVFRTIPPNYHLEFQTVISKIFKNGGSELIETKQLTADQSELYLETRLAAVGKNENINEIILITTDITKRKEAEAQLFFTQKELVEKAHKAGMAEIATDTIHNVGNILNSVQTSILSIEEILYKSESLNYQKACELLKANLNNLDNFIQNDPKGKKLIEYFLALSDLFNDERGSINRLTERLKEKVEAITNVIASQQSYVGANLFAKHPLEQIVNDALSILSETIDSYQITTIKFFEEVPVINIQKTKLVHIIINLIKNACEAMRSKTIMDRKLHLSITADNSSVYLKITDNGAGIPEREINKIFTHGYTTKANGHGFGLHSCANYMAEMRGEINVESAGIEKGSTFILTFNR